MKLLLLDNYDSFTWNLFHYLEQVADGDIDVRQNDEISIAEAETYDRIVLSPGPGLPDEAGITKEIIRKLSFSKPILGVCLGHQAIGEVCGAKLENSDKVKHGIPSRLVVKNRRKRIFNGIDSGIPIGHYHSWVVSKKKFPDELEITAEDDRGNIMALRHRKYNVRGVQFHPESVLTSQGLVMLRS